METFLLPTPLPIQSILMWIVGSALAIFLIFFIIWKNLSKNSSGRKILPRVVTAILLVGIGLVGYYAIIGNMNNETALRNSVVHNYNVNVLTFDSPKMTVLVNDTVRECEMRSNDQINYIVQCHNSDGTVTNLGDLKAK